LASYGKIISLEEGLNEEHLYHYRRASGRNVL
jgi:hypothetical protein